MELVLQAIETSEGGFESQPSESNSSSKNELETSPPLSFEQRPPQWCIVEKWFTMTVNCTDESIKELEAIVYNRSDGQIVREIQSDEKFTNDPEGKRAIATVNKDQRANFRLKFLNGSKGAWLELGLMASTHDKCILKSPPIKVQTNRSKRPRDSKKKPVPMVTSLSPSSVPSSGFFPGRKDRMLLIFGTNFHLWGTSPIVRLAFVDSDSFLDIRPPDLIWWNENLLECQLPEVPNLFLQVESIGFPNGNVLTLQCPHDLEVTVANFDYSFGEGKVLKVSDHGSHADDSRLLQLQKPLGNSIDFQLLTNNHLLLDFTQPDPLEEIGMELIVRVVLYVRLENSIILAETSQGTEKIPVEDIGVVLKLTNHLTNQTIREVTPLQGQHFWRNADNMMVTLKLPLETSVPHRALQVVVHLRQNSSRLVLLDPSTKAPIQATRNLLSEMSEEDTSMELEYSSSPDSRFTEPFSFRANVLKMISKSEEASELDKWEGVLNECLQHLRSHRNELERGRRDRRNSLSLSQGSLSQISQSFGNNSPKDEDDEELEPPRNEIEDESQAAIPVRQSSPAGSLENSTVYWKFFNPGTRTFLELTAGKLQIIGSRRIQMIIESIPTNAKFMNAFLYVQKGDGFDPIENCSRCKENGIPNVFCVLPKRGREYDYPWITFRITCTSTAKHWKGSPFWIGAEFLVDPSAGSIVKVFSPPIHVQSKVKSKDIEKSSPKYSRDSPSPSPKEPSKHSLDNFYALTQHSSAQLQQQKLSIPPHFPSHLPPNVPLVPSPIPPPSSSSFAAAMTLAAQLSRFPSQPPPSPPSVFDEKSNKE